MECERRKLDQSQEPIVVTATKRRTTA